LCVAWLIGIWCWEDAITGRSVQQALLITYVNWSDSISELCDVIKTSCYGV